MRKVLSLLVLALLVVHLAGVYLFSIVRMGEIRMEQRLKLASLPNDQLDVIRIPASKFLANWMEEREMEWEGKMYDIARVIPSGTVVIVYCLHDADEDDLLAFLSAVVKMANQDTQPAPTSVVNFFHLEFITTKVLIPQPAQSESIVASPGLNFLHSTFVPDPAFPPPRG